MTNVGTITSKKFEFGAPHEFFNSKYLLEVFSGLSVAHSLYYIVHIYIVSTVIAQLCYFSPKSLHHIYNKGHLAMPNFLCLCNFRINNIS